MSRYKAILMGGVALGLFSLQATSDKDGRIFSDQVKARLAKHQTISDLKNSTRVAEEQTPATDATAEPAASPSGKTEYYGVSDAIATPAWAQEAKFFEAVNVSGEAAPAGEMQPTAASEAPTVAETPAAAVPPAEAAAMPDVVHGTTWYPGETAHAEEQPFSAPATVFEQVTVSELTAAPAAEAPAAQAPAAAAAPVAAVVEVVHGATWYGGGTARSEEQPFSAPAIVFITVTDAPAAAPAPAAKPVEIVHGVTWYGGETKRGEDQPFSAPAKTMILAAPAATPAANSCRDQLSAIVQAGRILFENGSFDIGPDSYKTLDKLAIVAKSCGGVVIDVGGHTDNTGSPPSNDELSRLRAEAVRKYLIREGVDAAKLKATGYGQNRPVAGNDTAEGRQKNRRIEFVVTGG